MAHCAYNGPAGTVPVPPTRTPVHPVFVGLDMSLSSTGFCRKQGSTLTIETIKTTPKTAEDELARLRYICDEVMKLIPKDVRMICIEDYFTPGNAGQVGAAIKLVSLGTVMRLTLYDAKYPFFVVHPSQLKKFATGKGVGQKSIIVREVYKRWGLDCRDDNQADACVLAHIAEGLCMDKGILPDFQQEVVDKVFEERPCYNCGRQAQ